MDNSLNVDVCKCETEYVKKDLNHLVREREFKFHTHNN